ncbi:hypothetical protein [Montanilutibacter psychrotolerans]|uniref:ArsR family transcriptional regulator n=1 Tax=Montanilutibacter psychrotolerans TaxID=1327343 RepID=A0A3M8SPN5_9GAMM|nr:hypothetical protein [Lysobacter psychrotolerans]RNF82635.1 hypothetical protein EER27_14130 [Lysobacter psychrotolerans]
MSTHNNPADHFDPESPDFDVDPALALLQLLAVEDGQSIHRVAKRLGLEISQLQRLLTALGDNPQLGGLDLIEQRRDGERTLLFLTERGRVLCAPG